jgi:hypothetical protein
MSLHWANMGKQGHECVEEEMTLAAQTGQDHRIRPKGETGTLVQSQNG